MRRPLSYSQVSTWLRCPRLYRYRYVDRAEPEKVGMSLLLGSAVHDSLGAEGARRLEGNEGGLDYALRSFREMLLVKVEHPEALVDMGEKSLIEHFEVGEGLIRAYFEHGPVDRLLAVEKEFELDLGGDLTLAGVIDFVVQGEEGPEVVELKTAARSWSELQAKLSMQVAIYAMALDGEESVPVTYRVLVKNKTPKVQEFRLDPEAGSSERTLDTIREVAGGIEAACFPRNCSVQTCSGCAYFKHCQGRKSLAA